MESHDLPEDICGEKKKKYLEALLKKQKQKKNCYGWIQERGLAVNYYFKVTHIHFNKNKK